MDLNSADLYQVFQQSFERVAQPNPGTRGPVPEPPKMEAYQGASTGIMQPEYQQQQTLQQPWPSYPGGDIDYGSNPYGSNAFYQGSEQFYDPMNNPAANQFNLSNNYNVHHPHMAPPSYPVEGLPAQNDHMAWNTQVPTTNPQLSVPSSTTTSNYPASPSTVSRIKSENINSGLVDDAIDVMENISKTPATPMYQHPSSSSPQPTITSSATSSPAPLASGSNIPTTPVPNLSSSAEPQVGPGRKRKNAKTAGGSVGAVSSSRGGKRKKSEEVNVDPEIRALKDKERRFSNNTRERMRIRDINDALTELGRICMNLKPKGQNDKPQTKLGVLNMAVDIITNLEQKVRERNLNPSVLALHSGSVQEASSLSSFQNGVQQESGPMSSVAIASTSSSASSVVDTSANSNAITYL